MQAPRLAYPNPATFDASVISRTATTALAAQQPPPPGEATHKAALHAFIWR